MTLFGGDGLHFSYFEKQIWANDAQTDHVKESLIAEDAVPNKLRLVLLADVMLEVVCRLLAPLERQIVLQVGQRNLDELHKLVDV